MRFGADSEIGKHHLDLHGMSPVEEVRMSVSFPGESAQHRQARNRLLAQERELRRITEDVAAARRTLPPGGAVPENYVFEGQGAGGAPTHVTLSDLFQPGKGTLFIYSMMFPRSADEDLPCPSCTQFLDSFEGVAEHAGERINVAVVVKTELARVLAHAETRGGGGSGSYRPAAIPTTATTTARATMAANSCRC